MRMVRCPSAFPMCFLSKGTNKPNRVVHWPKKTRNSDQKRCQIQICLSKFIQISSILTQTIHGTGLFTWGNFKFQGYAGMHIYSIFFHIWMVWATGVTRHVRERFTFGWPFFGAQVARVCSSLVSGLQSKFGQ